MSIPSLFIKKYLPIFNVFIIFVFSLLAIFLFDYSFSYFLIFASLVVLLSFILFIIILRKEIMVGWPLLFAFVFFVAGATLFTMFIQGLVLKIFFIFSISLFAFVFLISVFRFFYEPRKYFPYSMENISFSLTLLAFVFISADLFALIGFFDFSLWLSLILLLMVVYLALLFINWLNKIKIEKKLFIFVPLMIGQLFGALTLLPTSFYINGLVLGLLFFLMLNLIIKKNKEGLLTQKVLQEHLILGIVVLFFIFLLTKWR